MITIKYREKTGKRGRPRSFDRHVALRNALRIFWEQGFEQTTMMQLTKAMGIASPSIYCAFGNKCDLFIEALQYYRKTYWEPEFAKFMEEPSFILALSDLFCSSAQILLSADAPCGCLTVLTAVSQPVSDKKLMETVNSMRANTKEIFEKRIAKALEDRQLRKSANISYLGGALTNFFEGLAIQAKNVSSLQELKEIAKLGINLVIPFATGNNMKN